MILYHGSKMADLKEYNLQIYNMLNKIDKK